jgi:phosphate transport system substrate-binding protein
LISNRSRTGGSKHTHAQKSSRFGMKARTCLVGVAAAGVLAVPATASATTYLNGSGSSAAQPYMEALFAGYHKLHKNIAFHYNPDGGNAGVKDVQNGTSEFAIQTAPPVAANAGTTFYKLFRDALCIDVNSKNKISSLSIPQVANIFEGIDTNWGQVSKSSGLGSQTIAPQGRNSAAGQYTFFVSAVLKGGKEAGDVSQLSSDGLVKNAVVKNKDAIGYVGLANSKAKGEKALKLNGKACTRANVKSEKYPLWRYDWAVLPKSHQNGQVVKFFNWVIHSHAAGVIINKAGAVAAFNS